MTKDKQREMTLSVSDDEVIALLNAIDTEQNELKDWIRRQIDDCGAQWGIDEDRARLADLERLADKVSSWYSDARSPAGSSG